jgi:hypothetical protein
MPQQVEIMTLHEKLEIGVRAIELEKQGKLEEAWELKRTIPMPPYLAKFAKEHFGPDYLIEHGWNLSEADAEYGADWLTR